MRVIVDFYSSRSLREKRLLMAMIAILVPLLIYFLLVVPLSNAYRNALQQHLDAVDRHGRVSALAARSAGGRAAVAPTVPDLSLYLIDSARQNGIEASSQGSANNASVQVQYSAAGSLFAWIGSLETAGFAIDSVRISPAGEGMVSGTFTVRGGRP